ncbi:MAG: response regulator transcription factor [Candidatus Hydrothermarchaeales archaeon]
MAKILVVDDDPDMRLLLCIMLRERGHDVIEASDGEECMEKIEATNPDLVFLDIMMPGMDGWEACKRIKEAKSRLPVFMISIRKDEEDIRKSLEYAGAERHFTKPIDQDELFGTVGDLLGDPGIDNPLR